MMLGEVIGILIGVRYLVGHLHKKERVGGAAKPYVRQNVTPNCEKGEHHTD
jgi:hypothetical protein